MFEFNLAFDPWVLSSKSAHNFKFLLKGKARDIRHDELVMQIAKDLSYCGIEARVEPRDMVNNWMTPAAFVNMSNAEGTRPLQGCIPDLLTRQPPLGGGAPQEAL